MFPLDVYSRRHKHLHLCKTMAPFLQMKWDVKVQHVNQILAEESCSGRKE